MSCPGQYFQSRRRVPAIPAKIDFEEWKIHFHKCLFRQFILIVNQKAKIINQRQKFIFLTPKARFRNLSSFKFLSVFIPVFISFN